MKHMLRSRYFVMIRKCKDTACCRPLRSPLRKVLPTGFLPPPRVYGHNSEGDLVLWRSENVDKNVKFASLSNILSQPIDQNLPFDTYNKKVCLKDVICPFCQLTLSSPAERQRHRRAMHYRQRAPAGFELKYEELGNRDSIKKIIDDNEGEYLYYGGLRGCGVA